MSMCRANCTPRHRAGWVRATVVTSAALMLASCGLPGGGSAHKVDDASVPYRLLESGAPSTALPRTDQGLGRVPVVFWVSGDRVVPQAADESCDTPPEALVKRLLDTLAAGPSEDQRADGRSSAIPPDAGLDLVRVVDGTVEVDIEPMTSLSAERLPVAVAQVVLTITSTAAVETVNLVSRGEPIQVPLPGGALTEGPVTAQDYTELLPDRLQDSGSFGCPIP